MMGESTRHSGDATDVERASDYVARMVISFIGATGRWDVDDDAALQDLVRHEILGGILT